MIDLREMDRKCPTFNYVYNVWALEGQPDYALMPVTPFLYLT